MYSLKHPQIASGMETVIHVNPMALLKQWHISNTVQSISFFTSKSNNPNSVILPFSKIVWWDLLLVLTVWVFSTVNNKEKYMRFPVNLLKQYKYLQK